MTSDELFYLEDVLKSHWHEMTAVEHAAWGLGGREAFIQANVAVFKVQRAATGRDVRDLIGTVTIVTAP